METLAVEISGVETLAVEGSSRAAYQSALEGFDRFDRPIPAWENRGCRGG